SQVIDLDAREHGRGTLRLQPLRRMMNDLDPPGLEKGRVDRVVDVILPVDIAIADEVENPRRKRLDRRRRLARGLRASLLQRDLQESVRKGRVMTECDSLRGVPAKAIVSMCPRVHSSKFGRLDPTRDPTKVRRA